MESSDPNLWKHQEEARKRAKSLDHFALFFEPGCLSGDSLIRINRCGVGRRISLRRLYSSFNGLSKCRKFNPEDSTYVRSWTGGNQIRLHKVTAVKESGLKSISLLNTEHKQLKLTQDHEVLTKRGWVRADSLVVGRDFIAVDNLKRHAKKPLKKAARCNSYKRIAIGQFHPHARQRPNRVNSYFLYEHRAVYEALLNGLTVAAFIKETHQPENRLRFIDPKMFVIHHKDHDRFNNDSRNLECLTRNAHMRHHGSESYSNFGHGLLEWEKVISIFHATHEEMTYDIVCEDPHRNFVANGMVVHNCGKTRAAISILVDKFHRHRRILNTLVLTPLVVVEQWERELHFWSSKIPKGLVMALKGPNWKRLRFLEDNLKCGYNVIAITNYEALYSKQLFDKLLDFAEIIVCDESSKLKDIKSKRSKLAAKIADKCRYRYILSGTPILSSPMDIFQQFKVLDKGATFGSNFYIFRAQHFFDKNAAWKSNHNYFPSWGAREDCSHNISYKIAPVSMHIKKEDAIDLPELVRKEVFVEMGAEQAKAYQEMRDLFVAIVQDRMCVAQLVLTKLLRLQQIVSGFLKFDDDTEREFYECPRLDALSELLEEITPTQKVIVWSVFKRNYLQIKKVCEKLSLPYAELTGDTVNKAEEIQRFQTDESVRVMIANQQAGGIGVNLTAAGTSIFYSKNFSLESDIQAEARNFRGGSIDLHKKVTRIDLVSKNTVDEIINAAIQSKLATNDEILSLLRKRL